MIRIYLDTNAFIHASEHRDEVSDLLAQIMVGPPVGDVPYALVTSEFTIAEALVVPLRDGLDQLVDNYLGRLASTDGLAGGLDVAPVSRSILVRAASLRARYRSLKMPDAVHLATALETRSSVVVSNDMRLDVGVIETVPLTSEALRALYARLIG